MSTRRPLPAAWTVALWITGCTLCFLLAVGFAVPGALTLLRQELTRRVLGLDGLAPIGYFVLLVGALALDALVLGWHRSSLGRLFSASRSARADLLLASLHAVGWAPLVMSFFSAGLMWAFEHSVRHDLPLGFIGSVGPRWLQFLLVLVLVDLLDYWVHRIAHDVDFLWESHRFHHSATAFTLLTGSREHALYEAFRHVIVAIPLAAFGAIATQYLGVRLLLMAIDLLQHSMVPWNYGWVGRWLVFSPIGHRIHHSPRADQHTSNYGNFLVIWDRLFGTWYRGDDVNETVGLPHNPYNRQSAVVEYLHTVARTARALRTSLRTGRWRTGPGTKQA